MNRDREFARKHSSLSRLLAADDHDAALKSVDSMRHEWPGNAHLDVLWARLVQLQEHPTHELSDVRAALEHAAVLENGASAAAIELGHFLDNVEDDPKQASKVFADAVAKARKLLLDGLIGQAKALRQLEKREEYLQCLKEILQVARFNHPRKGGKRGTTIVGAQRMSAKNGVRFTVEFTGDYGEEIGELLGDLVEIDPSR